MDYYPTCPDNTSDFPSAFNFYDALSSFSTSGPINGDIDDFIFWMDGEITCVSER